MQHNIRINMQRLKYMFFVFFAPGRFTRHATERIVALSKTHRKEPFTEADRAQSEEFARKQTGVLRRTFFLGIGITALTIVAGAFAGWVLKGFITPTKNPVYALQAIGAAIILGATLGQFGRKHESIGGENLADEMNGYIFRALYVVGTFLFVMSVSWDAA